ncbi:MAG: SDR family oxidoreductase [Verrucomicrobia bacterium]|nr:SDR family oxidoreductase [Verrucomicrobiota bacterium]
MKAFSLKGKTALVTGGNSGIGLGMARGLAKAGATVAITGRNAAKNERALAELNRIQPGCRGFAADLAKTDLIRSAYAEASKDMGGFDILINNAGTTIRGPAEDLTLDDWSTTMALNLTAPMFLSQCFARERIERKQGGSIIFTASLMSEASRSTTAAYTASKGGIRQLIKALAVDWAKYGIRVNGIGPGYIETDLTRPLHENEEFSAWVKKRTPLGRWGQPADLEGMAVLLASDASAFVTGQIFYVDGGWLATF